MKRVSLFCGVALAMLAADCALASSVCPVMTGGDAGGGGGVSSAYIADSSGTNGGCNVLITFNGNGSIGTTNPNGAISYDNGGDDILVGIVNNTSHPILSITLTGTTTPFGFDGDGACDPTWTYAGGNPCGTTTSGYGHQGVTFSGISGDLNTGIIDFASGIAPGGSNWFSLEGPVSLSLKVVPEPGSFLLLALGVGLIGAARPLARRLRL